MGRSIMTVQPCCLFFWRNFWVARLVSSSETSSSAAQSVSFRGLGSIFDVCQIRRRRQSPVQPNIFLYYSGNWSNRRACSRLGHSHHPVHHCQPTGTLCSECFEMWLDSALATNILDFARHFLKIFEDYPIYDPTKFSKANNDTSRSNHDGLSF